MRRSTLNVDRPGGKGEQPDREDAQDRQPKEDRHPKRLAWVEPASGHRLLKEVLDHLHDPRRPLASALHSGQVAQPDPAGLEGAGEDIVSAVIEYRPLETA